MAVVWKPVPSLPGVLASDDGRIVFPPKHTPLHHGGFRRYLPEPTRGHQRRAARDASHVYMGTHHKDYGNIKIHRAVCEAFHGPAPFPGAVVIHLDENALNNRPENLKWGTQRENMNMPKIKAYQRSRVREKSARGVYAAKQAQR